MSDCLQSIGQLKVTLNWHRNMLYSSGFFATTETEITEITEIIRPD